MLAELSSSSSNVSDCLQSVNQYKHSSPRLRVLKLVLVLQKKLQFTQYSSHHVSVSGNGEIDPHTVILIAVTLLFIVLMVSMMTIFTYKKLKARAQSAVREPLVSGGFRNPIFDNRVK